METNTVILNLSDYNALRSKKAECADLEMKIESILTDNTTQLLDDEFYTSFYGKKTKVRSGAIFYSRSDSIIELKKERNEVSEHFDELMSEVKVLRKQTWISLLFKKKPKIN